MTTRTIRANGRETSFAVVTPTGYRYTRTLQNDPETWEEWRSEGEDALRDHAGSQWRLGDWWRTGEKVFHELAAQAVDQKRVKIKTLQNYAWVAGRIAYSRRRITLSFSHHAAVAALEEADQERLLDMADHDDLPVEALEEMARDIRDRGQPGLTLRREIATLLNSCGRILSHAPAGRIRELINTAHESLEEASSLLERRKR